jgi:hypothetical protein
MADRTRGVGLLNAVDGTPSLIAVDLVTEFVVVALSSRRADRWPHCWSPIPTAPRTPSPLNGGVDRFAGFSNDDAGVIGGW